MRTSALSVLLACGALLALPGCAGLKEGLHAGDASGKPAAPVAVEAALSPGHARVTLRFLSPATQVAASVWGLDGLAVTPPPALPRTEYRAQETAVLEVPLGSPAGTLAVSVSGTFGGAPYSRAVTFAVGPGAGPGDAGVLVPTDQGPLRALPAGR